jgi:hypothetical protein
VAPALADAFARCVARVLCVSCCSTLKCMGAFGSVSAFRADQESKLFAPVGARPVVLGAELGSLQAAHGRKRGKYRRLYTQHDLLEAFCDEKLMSGAISLHDGSLLYNIPRSTLSDMRQLYLNKQPLRPPGRPSLLPPGDEQALLSWALYMARAGFPPTRGLMLDKAADLASKRGVVFNTTDGKPGTRWWRSFRSRHRDSFKMRAPARRSPKASVSREILNHFYSVLETTLKENDITPDRLWNMDETGIDRPGKRSTVFAAAGSKSSPVSNSVDFREHVTLVACVSAAGKRLPAYFIYKGRPGGKSRDYLLEGIADSEQAEFVLSSEQRVRVFPDRRAHRVRCRERLDDSRRVFRVVAGGRGGSLRSRSRRRRSRSS